jgi:hypothetical protein
MKHIDVWYHFMSDMVEDQKVLMVKVDTLKNFADLLMICFSTNKFSWCREAMGIATLNCESHPPLFAKKKTNGRMCYIFYMVIFHVLYCTHCIFCVILFAWISPCIVHTSIGDQFDPPCLGFGGRSLQPKLLGYFWSTFWLVLGFFIHCNPIQVKELGL